ncbi:hypothetical protein FRC06_009998 [Ceratobasidium sp. 370]|nr:hypothetical protein FRC06_009998 [Ceratobasidium sp. 370]
MIFVRFDAGEHEYESMSRHNRRVPTTFYDRFARDATAFADLHATGKLVGVLEGGYSNRALIAGGMAWTAGMIGELADKSWWNAENLDKLESTIPSSKRKPRASAPASDITAPVPEPWVARTLSLLHTLDATFGFVHAPAPRARKKPVPVPAGARMTLRDRNKNNPTSIEDPKSRTRKPKSTPASPAKNAKPTSVAKSSKPGSSAKVSVPLPPQLPPTDPSSVVTRAQEGGEAKQVQEGDLPDPVLDEATLALQTLSLDQFGAQGQSSVGPLVIKLRRSKAPQAE